MMTDTSLAFRCIRLAVTSKIIDKLWISYVLDIFDIFNVNKLGWRFFFQLISVYFNWVIQQAHGKNSWDFAKSSKVVSSCSLISHSKKIVFSSCMWVMCAGIGGKYPWFCNNLYIFFIRNNEQYINKKKKGTKEGRGFCSIVDELT